MKYNELHKLLKEAGCQLVTKKGGHPVWRNPKTGKLFTTSHHGSQEVKPGTLRSIMRDSGLK